MSSEETDSEIFHLYNDLIEDECMLRDVEEKQVSLNFYEHAQLEKTTNPILAHLYKQYKLATLANANELVRVYYLVLKDLLQQPHLFIQQQQEGPGPPSCCCSVSSSCCSRSSSSPYSASTSSTSSTSCSASTSSTSCSASTSSTSCSASTTISSHPRKLNLASLLHKPAIGSSVPFFQNTNERKSNNISNLPKQDGRVPMQLRSTTSGSQSARTWLPHSSTFPSASLPKRTKPQIKLVNGNELDRKFGIDYD